jgi:hypothetical protein
MIALLAALALGQAQTMSMGSPSLAQGLFSASAGAPGAYLIPEPGGATVLTHVNATDLHNGSSRVGGPWALHGTVPFNPTATPRPSVGPFATANYYSQPVSSPANVGAAPFTVVVIFNPIDNSSLYIPFSTGAVGLAGFDIEFVSGTAQWAVSNGTTHAIDTVNAITAGALGVFIAGLDGSGNILIQYNGGATASASGAGISASAVGATIGTYAAGGLAFNGSLFEVMVSTAVPSAVAFTALYNSIQANIGG